MVIWPLRVTANPFDHKQGGLFQVGGFLRMMGRFDGASGEPLPLDTYATSQFKADVKALAEPVHGFFDSLGRVDKRDSQTS